MATIQSSHTAQQLIVALTQMGEQEQLEFVEPLLTEPALRRLWKRSKISSMPSAANRSPGARWTPMKSDNSHSAFTAQAPSSSPSPWPSPASQSKALY
jgi:hypothetical protein